MKYNLYFIALVMCGIIAVPIPNSHAESRVDLVTFYSPALGISKNFNIYLPDDYDQQPQEYYPVVYLFRGHEREWVNRTEDDSRNNRNIKDVADQLYQNAVIGKMILVMPGLSSTDNSIPGLAVNFVNVSLAGGRSGLGSGRFEDFMIDDLIPYIDSHYRTFPFRSQRGVDGFSLGGYTAIMLASKHPQLFSSAGAYDGTLMWLNFDYPNSPGVYDDYLWLSTSMFDPIFGLPRDINTMLQYNPANLIYGAKGEKLELVRSIQFLIHSAGSEALGNLNRTQHIVDLLVAQGIENTFSDIRLTPTAQHNWWHADEHMKATLPWHWQKFQLPAHEIPLAIIAPVVPNELSGKIEIAWSAHADVGNTMTTVRYSNDSGRIWHTIATLFSADTTYLWDTTTVPDGTRYRLEVFIVSDSVFAVSATDSFFTINNPGNAAPDVEILSPSEHDVVSDEHLIKWYVADADGDSLTCRLNFSSDNGATWRPLLSVISDSSDFLWDTNTLENSSLYQLALFCSDDSITVSDTSGVFQVFNERQLFPPERIEHVAGFSNAKIEVMIVDAEQMTGDRYRITFDDTTFNYKVYYVYNIDQAKYVVTNASQLNGFIEGPYFDGLRLLIQDIHEVEVDQANTGWTSSNSNLEWKVYVPKFSGIPEGVAYAADYRIDIFDHVVDTSSSFLGAVPAPMNFTVRNISEDHPVDIIFNDLDNNFLISALDEIFILEMDDAGQQMLTWSVFFTSATPNVILPQPGDEFLISTRKPLTSHDVFEFTATLTNVAYSRENSHPLQYGLSQNYPNPFNATTQIEYHISENAQVLLNIYNVNGQLVKQLMNKNLTAGSYRTVWNGTDDLGMNVTSGLYFYRIEANGFVRSNKMVLVR